MKVVKLNTGVEVTFDSKGNMLNVDTPYYRTTPVKTTTLRWLVSQIKKIIA